MLGVLFAIEFIVLAIAPHDRKDWLLENALVVVLVGFMAGTYRKLTLSRISYFLIFVFLSLHLTGTRFRRAVERQLTGKRSPSAGRGRVGSSPKPGLKSQNLKPRVSIAPAVPKTTSSPPSVRA